MTVSGADYDPKTNPIKFNDIKLGLLFKHLLINPNLMDNDDVGYKLKNILNQYADSKREPRVYSFRETTTKLQELWNDLSRDPL